MSTEHEQEMARMQKAFEEAVKAHGPGSAEANTVLRDMARYAEVHGVPVPSIVRMVGEVDGSVPMVKRES